MPDIVTRATLTTAEIASIEQLIAICNRHDNLQMRIGPGMLREQMGEAKSNFLYYEDGKLAGYLWSDSFGTREKELVGMVHPAYRRQGIFRALLDSAKATYRQLGIEQLIFICEHSSQSGLACLSALGARYSFAEHKMMLGTFHERGHVIEGLHMRQAGEDDIDAIVTLLATDTGNVVDTLAWVSYLMGQPQYHFYLATLHSKPLGTLRLDFLEEEHEDWIYAFEVRLGYRGLGYGRQMLEQAIHIARAVNNYPILLDVETMNTNAIGLYQSCGFEIKTTYDYYELPIS
ncbi:MAG TPA: GNAT family N-acetyltransferase [Ktedonobacteraceae bacterium]|nr:GNAT family N-acetyltransferase [Ktedonobacteraceae bacterium]